VGDGLPFCLFFLHCDKITMENSRKAGKIRVNRITNSFSVKARRKLISVMPQLTPIYDLSHREFDKVKNSLAEMQKR
jgi:hypothetical protein